MSRKLLPFFICPFSNGRRIAAPLVSRALILAFVPAACAPLGAAQGMSMPQSVSSDESRNFAPALLSFDELVTLSSTAKPHGALEARLNNLLTTPFIHNDRTEDADPRARLRVAFWNIERGLNFEQIRAALSGPAEFARVAPLGSGLSEKKKALILGQLRTLADSDVIILNEVDFGMKRTEYRDVARELAAALRMDYAYGVEFVEVDPVFDLDTEQVHLTNPQEDARLQQDLQVDRGRYHGLHGNAILSRYPIRDAHILRLPVCHDWYAAEVREIAKLEKVKRWSADKLFRERVEREVRHGGRMALIAHISVPSVPTGEVAVVSVHLENKCPPACRRRQMQALLTSMKGERNPVVLAGDMNTTSRDNTPTSVRNEIMSRITDYRFWIKQTVSHFHPLGIFQYALVPVHYLYAYRDPTAFHVPILWENHERGLFRTVERFRFTGGTAFDFRGVAARTLAGRQRTLADSNARARKGFVPTYSFARDYGGLAGGFKLDWFFVKPFITRPRDNKQNYFFAPEFPATMRELNRAVPERISDHPPITLDLPLTSSPETPQSIGDGSRQPRSLVDASLSKSPSVSTSRARQ